MIVRTKNPVQMTLHVGALSAYLMEPVMIVPAVAQEQDDDQEVPSNVSVREPFTLSVPSEREHDQQEAVVERPTGIPPEQTSGDRVGGNVSDPVQSDGSECECQRPGSSLNINLRQLWVGPQRVVSSGRSSPQSTRQQTNSILSKPCYLALLFITR